MSPPHINLIDDGAAENSAKGVENRENAPLEKDISRGAAQGPEAPPSRRIPNLGHALLFVSFTFLILLLLQAALMLMGKSPATAHGVGVTIQRPKLEIAVEAATYLTVLLTAWFYYPLVWRRTFLDGLRWNWAAARSQASKLTALGLVLGATMQVVTYYITPPKTLPIDDFFATAADAWIVTFFGTIVAPVFEEVCFRGFLVPAFAIAYDWLSLPRTEEARVHWQTTTTLSPAALIFSAILTSILFAMLHAQQVSHLWAALLVLFSVSLLLTFVRVKTQSVAASAMVHAAYNGFIFLMTMIATGGYRHLDRMMK